jgi:molecular chaperone GrpE
MTEKEPEKPQNHKEAKAKKSEAEKLKGLMDDLVKEKNELFGKLQRLSADYANFQKRTPKQIADSVAYEKEMIIKSLLPVLDNLEHTLQNVHAAENVDVLTRAVKIIYDQMLDVLKSHNVEQIKALGEKFDPGRHEAMMRKAELDKEDNIVLEEHRRGYAINGRVIRPCRVIINKLPTETPAEKKETIPEEKPKDEPKPPEKQ